MSLPVEEEIIVCEHYAFEHDAEIFKLTDERTGEISYMVEFRVRCSLCHVPFEFKGLDEGVNFAKPFKSLGGLVLNAPLAFKPRVPVDESKLS